MTTTTLLSTRLGAADIARILDQPEPTEEQREVIEAPLAPLLVVAGAGSGKTETMAARVVYLVANGDVTADQVLGLTFTRKAAAELAQRVRARLRTLRARIELPAAGGEGSVALDADRPTIATYNAFAGTIARDHALRIGTDPDARLLTEAGAWQLADDLVQSWTEDLDVDRAPGTVTEAVLALANAVGEHLI
ncbi:UvrD-helicase domain-containing protein, partial [Georgenia sp. 10Sc9-8]|nr:UvrD-helicase domain-containing protein [Georgenia halotolerans]